CGAREPRDLCARGWSDFSEPAPVREPFGAGECLAWPALPHEEWLLDLATGASKRSTGGSGRERTCDCHPRHTWSSRLGASPGREPSIRVAAARRARSRACDRTTIVASRRAGGWP